VPSDRLESAQPPGVAGDAVELAAGDAVELAVDPAQIGVQPNRAAPAPSVLKSTLPLVMKHPFG